VYFIVKNNLIESKDRESNVIQTGSNLNSILGAHWPLFVTSAHSRQAGSSKDRQPGLPGIGGEPGGPVYRESVVKRFNRAMANISRLLDKLAYCSRLGLISTSRVYD
jgi:hypothetical protein